MMFFIHPKNSKLKWIVKGTYCINVLHKICEHLHDLYTLNSLSDWKGVKQFIPKGCLNSDLIYIQFPMSGNQVMTLKLSVIHNQKFWPLIMKWVEWLTLVWCNFLYAYLILRSAVYLTIINKTILIFLNIRSPSIKPLLLPDYF